MNDHNAITKETNFQLHWNQLDVL